MVAFVVAGAHRSARNLEGFDDEGAEEEGFAETLRRGEGPLRELIQRARDRDLARGSLKIWLVSPDKAMPEIAPEQAEAMADTGISFKAAIATSIAARLPLVSLVPRPYIRRPTISALNG